MRRASAAPGFRRPRCPGWLWLVLVLTGCGHEAGHDARIPPPSARLMPTPLTAHGDVRVDDYYWVRDDSRQDQDVRSLLQAENDYTRAMMAADEAVQAQIFTEMTARLRVDDTTVPVKEGDYLYHREFRAGGSYPVYVRQRNEPTAEPEVILDVNELSRGHDFYEVGNWAVSEGEDILAFAEDTRARNQFTIRFRDLDTGEYFADRIEGVESDLAWANDDKTLYYVRKDPVTLLPYQVYRHQLHTDAASDVLVYEEPDHGFYTSVYRTRSDAFVVISLQSTDASELRLIDLNKPGEAAAVFLPREPAHEYRIRHVPGMFYVITNWNARNFRVMQVADDAIGDKSLWREVIPHRSDVLIQDIEVFKDYLAVHEQVDGLPRFRIIDRNTGMERQISFPDPAYTASFHSNPDVNSTRLRYVYSSLTTPATVFDYHMADGTTERLKVDPVEGDFDPANYTARRLFITARDHTRIPVSLVYRTASWAKGTNPLYVHGYGSYGIALRPSFSSVRLSLLDRGFVYAVAHVRGGDEMGRAWYEGGRLHHKRNTFNDFVDVTRALVTEGYGAKDKVFAAGGSAGGLLMGVIANEAPELYRGIIARVPFVDVVTTMLDRSIPLTTGELREWGDPTNKLDYDYMLGYSPYDQVKAQDYPHMLVTTGYWDSQVQYYEPVKWVAKLRRLKTDNHLLLLQIDMATGHNGASDRYDRYREDALEVAFLLKVLQQTP